MTTFHETLKLELPGIEEVIREDYPDQTAEHHFQIVTTDLVSFVRRVADKHSLSETEARAIELDVAIRIIQIAQMRVNSDLLRERLEKRFPKQNG